MLKPATLQEAAEAAKLALLLWPDHTLEEFVQEMRQLILQDDSNVFLAYQNNEAIGFAQCQLRYD